MNTSPHSLDSPAEFDLDQMLEALVQGQGEWVLAATKPFAEAGVPKAQLMMGILYQTGMGVEQNGHLAVFYYRSAAEAGEALAWKNLGTLYLLGLAGVPIDKTEAHHCFSRARSLELEDGVTFSLDQTIH